MRNVKGFLSDDGVFFDAEADAELYEAMHALEATVRNIGADPNKFLIVVEGCRKQLERYLNAKSSFEKSERSSVAKAGDDRRSGEQATPFVEHNADDGSAEAYTPVLEQPINESEHVPNMGCSVSTEAIPDDSALNGSRGRRFATRSVRSAPYMATASRAALATACGSDSPETVRQTEASPKLPRSDV